MSSDLTWSTPNKVKGLSDELKYALRKIYGEPVNVTLDESNLPELRSAALFEKSLNKAIKLIEKHDTVLFEETH